MICSPTANSTFDGRLAYVPGWEDVLVWDVKRGEQVCGIRSLSVDRVLMIVRQVAMWHSTGLTSPITYLVPAPLPSSSTSTSPQTFAVSYSDGSIRLWSFDPSAPRVEAVEIVTFNGHKKSVTTMNFDRDGSRLASGGTEGEIVVWDRIAEVGLFRLKGHRAPVTALRFIPHPRLPTTSHPGFLLSTARDSHLKLWDLGTQHCIQTVVVGRGEAWSLGVKEEAEVNDGQEDMEGEETVRGRWVVLTGSGDGEAKVWSIEKQSLTRGMAETVDGEVSAFNISQSYQDADPRFPAPHHCQTRVHSTPSCILPAHHTNHIPSHTTSYFPSHCRPHHLCPPNTVRGRSGGETRQKKETGEGKGT